MKSARRALHLALAWGVTALAFWWVLRGLDGRQLLEAFARADLVWLVALSVPAHLLVLYLRGLRWRILTHQELGASAATMFRAVAVGFMGNNVFPLRAGEFLRCWYLGRETGTRIPALLGSAIVERLLDFTAVAAVALTLIAWRGPELLGAPATALFVALLGVPLLLVALMRIPHFETWLLRLLRLLPESSAERARGIVGELASGLRGIRGWRQLGPIALWSAALWFVLAAIPFWAALWATGLEGLGLGSADAWAASLAMVVWVALVVALPSAPGFFGPYHAACWIALEPFGVGKGEAIAVGTLAHATFWVVTTVAGAIALRVRGAHLPRRSEVEA